MIALLIKASLILAILWVFYKMLLQKETFFAKNRLYLIICLLLTFALPFISIPKLIDEQGIVANAIEQISEPKSIIIPSDFEASVLSSGSSENQPDNAAIDNDKDASNLTKPAKGIVYYLLWIYFFGSGVMLLQLITQLISLIIKILKSDEKIEDTESIIINSNPINEPFSFFNYLFINPESYDFETYEQILEHERIHVKKRHSFDLLLAELVIVVLWFNPLAWLFRKDVERNIEYQTDDLLLHGEKEEKEQYQMNLLRIATNNRPLTVTTNYNQSLIKQRILKMNSKKSNPHSYWKYAFIIPVLFATLVLLNRPNEAFASLEKREKIFVSDVLSGISAKKENPKPEEPVKSKPISSGKKIANKSEPKNVSSSCDDLENAAKQMNIKKVRDLLQNYDTDCLNIKNEQQINNIEAIRLLAKANAEINIEKVTGNIEVVSYIVKVKPNYRYRNTRQRLEFIGCFNHPELNAAIADSNELLAMDLMKKLEKKHLIETDQESWEFIKLVKTMLEEDADISFDKISFNMIHDEESLSNQRGFDAYDSQSYNDNDDYEDSPQCKKLIKAILNEDISAVEKLLKESDPNCVDPKPDFKIKETSRSRFYLEEPKTALVAAARVGNITIGKILVKAGAKIDFHARDNETPLIAAASFGSLEFVQYLLDEGADINEKLQNHGTPLMAASRRGHLEVAKFLVNKGADVKTRTPNQGTALIGAANNGQSNVVEYLISQGADVNRLSPNQGTAILSAANNGHTKTVKLLLSKGARIDEISPNQGTPLIVAANNGHIETVKYLLEQGAELDQISPNQGNAILSAANNGHMETLEYLLSKGADINKITPNRGTPLIVAANNGHTQTVEFLIENGADIDLISPNQGTALLAAANNGHLETVRYLLDKGADINKNSSNRGTALIVAANNGQLSTVKFLLTNGAKINNISPNQGTALIVAANNGQYKTVKYLVENGAKVDLISPNQGTALGRAVNNRHVDVVKYLLEKGADPYKDSNNSYPMYHARRNNDRKMIKLLESYSKD